MKRIVCEICGCSSFSKKDGQFICQECGTAYSAEAVKGMMREVEETAAAEAVQAPNQKLLNLLVMASTAFEAGKLEESDKYCDRAIEMDKSCYIAWMLKAKSAGWKSTADKPTLNYAVEYFCVALDSAPEAEKEALKLQAMAELEKIGLAVLEQNGEKFAGSPSKYTLFDFVENTDLVLTAIKTIMDYGTAVPVPVSVQSHIAGLMNQVAELARGNINKAWNTLEHPGKQQFEQYRACYDSINGLLESAIKLSESDESQAINAYRIMDATLKDFRTKKIFRQEKNQDTGEMVWIAVSPLSDLEIVAKNLLSTKYSNAISELEAKLRERKAAEARAAEEAKQQRIRAYWEAHAEEKANLDAEREELEQRKKKINGEIDTLNAQIAEIERELNKRLPQDAEIERLKAEIWKLNKGRLGVGIFNFKGQKEVNAQIDPLKKQKTGLEAQAKAERAAIKADVKSRTEPLKVKISELKNMHKAAENRQNVIHTILTRDPEEVQADK